MTTIIDYLNGRLTMIEEAISRETLSGNAAKLDCERHAKAEVMGALDWLRRAPEETGSPPQRSGLAIPPCERCREPAEVHFCKPCFDHLYGVTDVEWCA
jgi:hypothetical protein